LKSARLTAPAVVMELQDALAVEFTKLLGHSVVIVVGAQDLPKAINQAAQSYPSPRRRPIGDHKLDLRMDPRRAHGSQIERTSSRLSDIAYSSSPTALKASAGSLNHWKLTALPFRTVQTYASSFSRCTPLVLPRAVYVANTTTWSPTSLISRTSIRMSSNASFIAPRASS